MNTMVETTKSRIKLSMKGFTLIELLVVVLIIGILASIALPQYQATVLKSRVAPYLPVLKTIALAKNHYRMETGGYTNDVSVLDVSMPVGCSETSGGGAGAGRLWACQNDFLIDSTTGGVALFYCPDHNATYNTCYSYKEIQLVILDSTFKFEYCTGYTARGKAFCKKFKA